MHRLTLTVALIAATAIALAGCDTPAAQQAASVPDASPSVLATGAPYVTWPTESAPVSLAGSRFSTR